ANLVEEAAGNRARQRGLTVRDAVEEGGDLLGRLGLQEIAGCTGANRLEEVLLRAGRGQDNDLAIRGSLAQPRQRRQAVEAGHGEVEEDDIRPEPARLDDRLGAVGSAAHDVEPVGTEERRERLAGQRVVVDDQDPGSHSWPLSAGTHLPTRGTCGKTAGPKTRAGSGEKSCSQASSARAWRSSSPTPGCGRITTSPSSGSCSRRRWRSPDCSLRCSPPRATRSKGAASTCCSRAASSSPRSRPPFLQSVPASAA